MARGELLSVALHKTAHHVATLNGGENKLSSLVSLCRFHRRAVHKGGIVIHGHDMPAR
jgi:hypothetical protein